MTTLSAAIRLAVAGQLQSAMDLGIATFPFQYNLNAEFTNGAGANQADKLFSDTRTLAASATENVDLNGVLADAFGNLLAFTKIKAMVIKAAAGNTNDVLVGGAASNGAISFFGDATDVVKVKPGGTFVLVAPDAAGYAVTAGTADLLKIANSGAGTAVSYDIVLIGA